MSRPDSRSACSTKTAAFFRQRSVVHPAMERIRSYPTALCVSEWLWIPNWKELTGDVNPKWFRASPWVTQTY